MFGSTRNRARATFIALLAAATAAACETPLEDRILDIDATGQVLVFLFRDNNLNGLDNADTPLRAQKLFVRRVGVPSDFDEVTTDSLGFVHTVPLGIGQYQVELSPDILGDSLEVLGGTAPFSLIAGDTVLVAVRVAFPSVSIDSARTLPIGKKVWVRGTTLHNAGIFGDTTLHVADSVAAIRITDVLVNINAGNAVQVLGTRQERNGQPVHVYNSAIATGNVAIPRATALNTGQAANANGGESDAALVEIRNAAISDTAFAPFGKRLTIDDGSGPLEVFVHNSLGLSQNDRRALAPGISFDFTGVLVPSATTQNVWVLKPRTRNDIVPVIITPAPGGG
jgi:hypothetical protein